MDIFEMLVIATAPVARVKVTGVMNVTCIQGSNRATLICADGVDRVMHYRGSLSDAIPTGFITVTDISAEMNIE